MFISDGGSAPNRLERQAAVVVPAKAQAALSLGGVRQKSRCPHAGACVLPSSGGLRELSPCAPNSRLPLPHRLGARLLVAPSLAQPLKGASFVFGYDCSLPGLQSQGTRAAKLLLGCKRPLAQRADAIFDGENAPHVLEEAWLGNEPRPGLVAQLLSDFGKIVVHLFEHPVPHRNAKQVVESITGVPMGHFVLEVQDVVLQEPPPSLGLGDLFVGPAEAGFVLSEEREESVRLSVELFGLPLLCSPG